MKNSGVEWIGEIPEDWDVKPVKRYFSHIKRIVGDDVDKYERLSLTMQGVLKRSKDDAEGLQPEKFNGYQILKQNELVFKLIDLENVNTSRVGISPFNGLVSPAYIILTNNKKDNTFYYYWFLNMYYQEIFNKLGDGGVRSALNASDVLSLPMVYLNNENQQRIASYLDKKCSKIEETIQNQQQVIEKLKTYKQSLITEAVTGKIKIQNGKVCGKYQSYKESGVEWIGKIPSEWSCVQIKNIFRFLGGYAFNSEDYVDETEYQILRIGNVKDFKILFDSSPAYISKETALKVENFKLKAGYILFTMTGTRGKKDYFYTHKVTDADCTKKNIYLNQRVGCLIPNSNISSSYFNYLLKDNLIKDSVFLSETGTANQANIGSDDVMRIKLHCPPKEEQKEIADYLDKKCTAIDTAIEQKQNLIEKLTEYKKSLIYECVTGKKEC